MLAALLLTAVPFGVLAQGGLSEVATVAKVVDKAADVARQRDVVWLAMVACIIGNLLAGYVVYVSRRDAVRMADKYSDLAERYATAQERNSGELREIREDLDSDRKPHS
jgi:hypothetical protein